MVDFIIQTSPKISEITETSIYYHCSQVIVAAFKTHKKSKNIFSMSK